MSSALNWKVAGLAGEGIATTGLLFAKLAMRHQLYCFAYGEYPSLIRGGHNTLQVGFDTKPVTTQIKAVDLMIALNEDAIKLHLDEFSEQTVILADKANSKINWDNYQLTATVIDVPFKAISLEKTQGTLAENMVSLGACSALLGFKLEILQQLIAEIFGRKGEVVVQKNQEAAAAGFAQITEVPAALRKLPLSTAQHSEPHILVSGSEAIGLGALSAGIQFYAAYPMSPSSTVLHFMAEHEKTFPLVVKHAEDEISAINQAVGASFAGVRAMTGSAGGGFALMVETTSLAGVAETPLVVFIAQRPGPATGLPTWTCQADLQFVLHAGHGEFPKVVLAPGDMEESFTMTRLAFELAEKYQTQVYLMSDKYLLESAQTVPAFPAQHTNTRYSMVSDAELPADNSYQRFVDLPEGYSPRSIPGQPHGLQLTNSYEHDEHGYATEDGAMTIKMVNKRMRKMDGLLKETPPPQLLGPTTAEITFITWGSTKLVMQTVLEALNTTEQPNKANCIHLATMMPFHSEAFQKLASAAKNLVIVEGNATGQLQALIREHTGIVVHESIRRYDGRPFYSEDLIAWAQARKAA
jgi:2-oxoglutarate ferredoxin oxidoreductase subunit alpha